MFKVAWSGLADTWSAVGEILANLQLSVEDHQAMMGAIDVDGQSVEKTVRDWMETNPDTWQPVAEAATE